jgi:nitronate monooxygenase
MIEFPKVEVSGARHPIILVQGGMGAGVSLARLAGAVARRGGVGIVSSVALDLIVSRRLGYVVNHFEAAKVEIKEAIRLSGGQGAIGINVMLSMHTAIPSILGAVAGGAKFVFAGAGISRNLPTIVNDPEVVLVPIVSSARVLEFICEAWGKLGYRLKAAVIEGPLAGGHLGYAAADIENPAFQLENLLRSVLAVSQEYDFPIIVAGGIWDREAIIRLDALGAGGMQIGTRFLATEESGASALFKQAVIDATADDIIVANNPGSPARMPFRVIASSPGYQQALERIPTTECPLGYMVHWGKCLAFENADYFCICNGLLSAIGLNPDPSKGDIYTVGAIAARVDKISTVDQVIDELTGFTC